MTKGRLIPLLSLLLAGCATGQLNDGYPSLTKRTTEAGRVRDQNKPATVPEGAAPAEPKLVRQLAVLNDQAERGGAAFDSLFDQVSGQIRVATSAPVSSEQWVAAHVALGRLEHARYDSVYALASTDLLYIQRMKDIADGKAKGGIDEILATRGPLLTMVDAQNSRLDTLRAVLQEP